MKNLFGEEENPVQGHGIRRSKEAHSLLLRIYGTKEGHKCGSCAFFYFKVMAKKYPKCMKANLKGSTLNSDWSSRWQACGLFKQEILK